MKLAFRLGGFVVEGGFYTIRKAFGISSYRKNNDDGRFSKFHNLLFDFDGPLPRDTDFDWTEKSPNGFHAIKLGQYSIKRVIREMLSYPNIDATHVFLGARRGYWFLETYKPVPSVIADKVCFMEIERIAKNVRRLHRLDANKKGNFGRRLSVILGR